MQARHSCRCSVRGIQVLNFTLRRTPYTIMFTQLFLKAVVACRLRSVQLNDMARY